MGMKLVGWNPTLERTTKYKPERMADSPLRYSMPIFTSAGPNDPAPHDCPFPDLFSLSDRIQSLLLGLQWDSHIWGDVPVFGGE